MQGGRPAGLTLVLRAARPAGNLLTDLRNKVRTIDPALPLFDAGALEEAVDSSFETGGP
jgi:hypothetical protein